MKRLVSVSLGVLMFVCLLVGSERRAWGYVNPGDGLLALQSFASVMAAGMYFLRRRILGLFTRKAKPSEPSSEKTIVLPVASQKNDSRNAA